MVKVLNIRGIFEIIFAAALPMCALGFLIAAIGDDIDIILLPLLLVSLSGMFVPIISYIWYIRHGGRRKWIIGVVFTPLILLLLSLLVNSLTAGLIREYYDSHRCPPDTFCPAVIPPKSPVEIWTDRLRYLVGISLCFNGVFFPIVFYRWYIARGGKKFWLSYLAYAPLIIMMLILFWSLSQI